MTSIIKIGQGGGMSNFNGEGGPQSKWKNEQQRNCGMKYICEKGYIIAYVLRHDFDYVLVIQETNSSKRKIFEA